jgi:hypothetical protein
MQRSPLIIKNLTIVEKADVIQLFELSFKLSWGLMKDDLAFSGYP